MEDYDNVSYPLVELGWSLKRVRSARWLYTLKDWMRYHFSPFVHNVKDEGIARIAMSLSAEDMTAKKIKAQTHNGVVGQLGLNYVSKGLLTKDEGRLYSRLLQHRITGDYNDLIIL